MVFTKNYYTILGLDGPSREKELTQDALRKAYKSALLTAHPDKATVSPQSQTKEEIAYTIDDVKEALAVLTDGTKRKEYDRWLAAQGQSMGNGNGGLALGTNFVLGLELLDLSDFEASMPFTRIESGPSTPDFDDLESLRIADEQYPGSTMATDNSGDTQDSINDDGVEDDIRENRGMEWTRACRCGAERGFRILERELEEAEERGEKEVLVGCEGCSLWVRVGFDVEEG